MALCYAIRMHGPMATERGIFTKGQVKEVLHSLSFERMLCIENCTTHIIFPISIAFTSFYCH